MSDHEASECKGGTGWVGDAHGGMPWDPCTDHWPTKPVDRGSLDGPRSEFVTMTLDEAETMFPGFLEAR